MPESPYRAGNPVGGSPAFVGRESILRRVLRVLANPDENAIVLYGQRRIGKSSVLQELATRLTVTGIYHAIDFDLQDKAARSLDEVLAELAQRIATHLDAPAPVGWAEDVQERFKSEFLPQILERLPSNNSLVLLFDEFDVLDGPTENQAGAAFFPYLRDLLTFSPRLQFVFVIGRRPEELSTLTLSVFKGVPSERISLLDESETTKLVTLSQANGTLIWTQDTSAEVFRLAGGHPFLTQQLCQEIWEEIHDNEDAEHDPIENLPTVMLSDVHSAVPAALRSATNALEWLWNGLGPAARIVASALAGAGVGVISQEELERRLQESGVRMLIGELRDAPRTLQDWDLIEPVDGGYRFRVEMLRRWIAENKPLGRVQQEIDYVQPMAENLFQVAYALYQSGQLDEALVELRRVVRINPNHLRGTELLAELLIVEDQLEDARQLLERLYQYNPATARPRLVQVLQTQAQSTTDTEMRLALYEYLLTVDPKHSEAVDFVFDSKYRCITRLVDAGKIQQALDSISQLQASFPDKIQVLEDIRLLAMNKEDISNLDPLESIEDKDSLDESTGKTIAREVGDSIRRQDLNRTLSGTSVFIETDEYKSILRNVMRNQSCLVVGLPRSGKSEILKHLYYRLTNEGRLCLLIDTGEPSGRRKLANILDISESDFPDILLIDEIEGVLSHSTLLTDLRTLQVKHATTIIATAIQNKDQLYTQMHEPESIKVYDVFPQEYFILPWTTNLLGLYLNQKGISIPEDFLDQIIEQTGGIPGIISIFVELIDPLELINNSLDLKISSQVTVNLQEIKAVLSSFFMTLSLQQRCIVFLSSLIFYLKQTRRSNGQRQVGRILEKYYGELLDNVCRLGLVDDEYLLRSSLLQEWSHIYGYLEYMDTIRTLTNQVVQTDFLNGNLLVTSFELVGVTRQRFVTRTEQKLLREKMTIKLRQAIGLLLIGLTIWSILVVMGFQ